MSHNRINVEFWLPNVPATHGNLIAAHGSASHVGDQILELVDLRIGDETPDGVSIHLIATFEAVQEIVYPGSFDELFRLAHCPWPGISSTESRRSRNPI